MRARKRNENIVPRYLGIADLGSYLSVGTSSARKIGKESGALRKIGTRRVYDRYLVDDYLANSQQGCSREEENE